MRIKIDFNADNITIPFCHQHLLTGVIHKWLGENKLHGTISLYSFSRLEGGKSCKNGLQFGKYGSFFFSAHDPEVVNLLIKGIFRDKNMFMGLSVEEISVVPDPVFDGMDAACFYVGSPILIKRSTDTGKKHYVYTDEQTDALLKETLQHKLQVAGMEDDSLEIRFDRDNPRAATKLIDYDGIKNKANWCPVIIKAKPETLLFAWNVGLGNSTGIGFGAIR